MKEFILIMLCNACIIFTLVIIQSKALSFLDHQKFDIFKREQHSRSVFLVLGILLIHMVQVWAFAFAYYALGVAHLFGNLGSIVGSEGVIMNILDLVYFSFTCFTTVGFGDITPKGSIRFLTSAEAISGFVLITWSASFLFIQMQKDWQK